MKDKIEVHKIDIKIGDKTISLKPEQAKELKRILNEMFEEKERVVHEHHWRYWWNYPTYINPVPYSPPSPMWTVTCGDAALSNAQCYQNQLTANTVQLALNAT